MCKKLFVLVLLVAFTASMASAAIDWDNDSGTQLWDTAANWDGDALPGSGDNVDITSGLGIPLFDVTVIVDGDADSAKLQIDDGSGFGTNPVILRVVSGGTLTTTGDIEIGMDLGDFGILELLVGGAIDVDGGSDELEVGGHGTGLFNMYGGELLAKDIRLSFKTGQGTMIMSGGTAELTDDLEIASSSDCTTDSIGTLVMSGGTITVVDDFVVGRRGTGSLIMSGGSITVDDDVKAAYDGDGGTANITMTGGTFTANDDFAVGRKDVGNLNISGTALLDIADDLELGQLNGGVGTMIMTGGTVNIGDDFELSKGNADNFGTSSLVMSGGTITAKQMKMAQQGGTATVVMTGGLIELSESLNITHQDQSGTTGTLTLGDGEKDVGALGDATIDTMKLKMDNAYADDVTAWIDFLPGGLLLIREGDVTGDIQTLIDDGFLLTTYAGGADWWDLLYPGTPVVGYDFGETVGGSTAVYLIPEPATIVLLGFGALALIRKKR